ncbi:MAG: dihydrodipicolinate synthase family protein [Chloroflexota bacterium]
MTTTFQGAWPALVTPTTADGDVSLPALHDLVEYLLGKKADGLYLCGSTGEGTLQSTDERVAVTQAVMEQVGDQVPIIVHVGSMNTHPAVALAKHAQSVGAAGVSSVLPLVKGDIAMTYRHYEAIAAAVPTVPFFPYLFGGQVDAVTLMHELQQRIPNLAGAKYTGPNMYEMGHVIELGDTAQDDTAQESMGWTIFSGMDEQCLFGAMAGAPGNIGTTLNVMQGIYGKLRTCYAQGDVVQALDLQKRANRVTTVLISHGIQGALREALRLLGLDCGDPRPPHMALAPEQRERLKADLEEVGFFEIAAM